MIEAKGKKEQNSKQYVDRQELLDRRKEVRRHLPNMKFIPHQNRQVGGRNHTGDIINHQPDPSLEFNPVKRRFLILIQLHCSLFHIRDGRPSIRATVIGLPN